MGLIKLFLIFKLIRPESKSESQEESWKNVWFLMIFDY